MIYKVLRKKPKSIKAKEQQIKSKPIPEE